LTTPRCRVCGSNRTGQKFPRAGLDILQCRECTAAFRPQGQEPEDPERFYNEEYFLHHWPGSLGRFFHDFNPGEHHKTRFFERQLAEFETMLDGPARILDVGCANGVFLSMARERGWEAEGVEISGFAAQWGERQFNVRITKGAIKDLPPEPAFDVITLWDTLEHLPDPSSALAECHTRIKEDGILAVLTPDMDSLINHLVNAAYRVRPKRARPFLEKLYHEDHLTYFNRHSLCLALIQAGFCVQWIEDYDEDPRDTETKGLMRLGLYAVHLAAALINRRHELLVWARKGGSTT